MLVIVRYRQAGYTNYNDNSWHKFRPLQISIMAGTVRSDYRLKSPVWRYSYCAHAQMSYTCIAHMSISGNHFETAVRYITFQIYSQ